MWYFGKKVGIIERFLPILKQGVDSTLEGKDEAAKESSEEIANLNAPALSVAENDEKMETNEETAPTVVEETAPAVEETSQESIQNGTEEVNETTAELETEQTQNVEEVKSAPDEVETAINEQELKYWNAVNENPQDFTSWTYLLQFVEQEVRKPEILVDC